MSRKQNQHRVPTPILAGPGSGDDTGTGGGGGGLQPAPVLTFVPDSGSGNSITWTYSGVLPYNWGILTSEDEAGVFAIYDTVGPTPFLYYDDNLWWWKIRGVDSNGNSTTHDSNEVQSVNPPSDELVVTRTTTGITWIWNQDEPAIWEMVMCTDAGVALTGTEESCIPFLGTTRLADSNSMWSGGCYFLVGVASMIWHPGDAELTPRSSVFVIPDRL